MPFSSDPDVRANWTNSVVDMVKTTGIDGITFDYESAIPQGDIMMQQYIQIINETNIALKNENAGYQVSVCAAWTPGLPNGIDGRAYDYKALSDISDFLYVMQYDTRSQIYDQCVASANCPLPINKKGIQDYLGIGIQPNKLIMGIPWYGYNYPCENSGNNQTETCDLKLVPFRGVNCSDAAGSEIAFQDIMTMLSDKETHNITTDIRRGNYLQTPNFNYVDSTGKTHQLWFDDPESLTPKYQMAKDMNLRGVGPYRFDQVDPVNQPDQFQAMFDALRVFLPDEDTSSQFLS